MHGFVVLAYGCLGSFALAGNIRPELKDGVVSYITKEGNRKSINVGARCADLWVAPDESVLAFISIDRSRPGDFDEEPFILASTLYVARRNEEFVPVRIALKVLRIEGRDWKVFRKPKVLPDMQSVIFNVPTSMTSYDLFAYLLKTGLITRIGDAIDYCVQWGGEKSGTILMQQRRAFVYQCCTRAPGKGGVHVVEGCGDFEKSMHEWNSLNGGRCN